MDRGPASDKERGISVPWVNAQRTNKTFDESIESIQSTTDWRRSRFGKCESSPDYGPQKITRSLRAGTISDIGIKCTVFSDRIFEKRYLQKKMEGEIRCIEGNSIMMTSRKS